jgi:uncharacterized protein YndB with AHSA1/START domain
MEQNTHAPKENTEASTDRIQKKMLLRAPRARVWRALTQAAEFGTWFCAKLSGELVPGSTVRGPITLPGYEHLTMELTVERMEPERLFSFRWHPYAVDPAVDYSSEPTTLVTFELTETPEGTSLTVTESGFDKIPAGRRTLAFRMNDEGWGAQLENIARYLAETRD